MGKILLYYKYVTIKNPDQIVTWQKELCQKLELKGRIIIAHEGINGTVGGTVEKAEEYKREMLAHPLFADIPFKESQGCADNFPKLSIKHRREIVNLGVDPDDLTVAEGAKHLTPKQVHELLSNRPDDLVLLDTRNSYESAVGTFSGSIIPNTKSFRDFPEYIDKNAEQLKDKKVLMFCTGGVRCERASGYLKRKGIKDVYQIEGGIHCYTEKYPDGFFRGKNYVFDNRMSLKVNDDVIGSCLLCKKPCDTITNCYNVLCNKQFISCMECFEKYQNTCGTACQKLVATGAVKRRQTPALPR